MAIDITSQLDDAGRLRAAWSPDHARSLAASFARAIPDAWVDWDEESGEEWARVLVDQFVVALIRAKIPLVIVVRSEFAQVRQIAHDAVSIVVDDMDSPWLSATSESIGQTFPEREVSPTLDPSAFSAMDLWFATT